MNVAGYNAHPIQPRTEFLGELGELRLQLQEEDAANAVFNPAAGLVSDTYTTNGTQLDNIIGDARIQYLAGQIDEAGLDAAVELWRTSGGDQVTTEINELYSQLG
jgi:putative aldouronate transport system substrate-binding protein